MYKVKAFESRKIAEAGRVTPSYQSLTGSYDTARHYAADLAQEYGAAVVENTDTGNRVWFESNNQGE